MPTNKACLRCEGRGTVRSYLNIAGDYNILHCEDCSGIGREQTPGAAAGSPLALEALERWLTLAKTRIEILHARNRGCREDHPDTHEVSEIEVPGWLEEMDDQLARLRAGRHA